MGASSLTKQGEQSLDVLIISGGQDSLAITFQLIRKHVNNVLIIDILCYLFIATYERVPK